MLGYKKELSLLVVLLFIGWSIQASFTVKKEVESMIGVPFLSSGVAAEASVDSVNSTLVTMKKNADESNKSLVKILNKVNSDIVDIQPRLRATQDPSFEYLNKKSLLLNARKQILMSHQELWRELIELLEQHIALLKGDIEYHCEAKEKPKLVYSWKDFREKQLNYAEHKTHIDVEKRKRDTIGKQITSEKESLASLGKQLEAKEKDREKLVSTTVDGNGVAVKVAVFKNVADVFEQEGNLLNEKIELSKLKIEKLNFEEKYKNDEINQLLEKLEHERDLLAQIERRLLLDFNDVEIAKSEWNNEVQKSLQVKDNLNKVRETKNFEKEKLTLDLEFIREKIKQMNISEDKDTISGLLVRSNLQKLNVKQWLLDKEIQVVDAKKDIADVLAKLKELQYLSIEIRYRLKNEQVNEHVFDDLLANFKNQKELEASNHKSFKEKQHEAVLFLIENKRTTEEIKLKVEKIKGQRASLFKGKDASLETIFANYEDAQQELVQLTQITQDFFAVSSELIGDQEAVLNAYTWIINDLESRKIMQGIWQRSSRAISLKAFLTSLSEADAMGKRFFWDTPVHLSPAMLWSGLQKTTMNSLLWLFLFLLLFVLGFILSKFVINKINTKIAAMVTGVQAATHTLYINSAQAIVLFVQEHFVSLFVLVFLYLHIALHGWASQYYLALFYLITIPIFVYLSSALVDKLKELNKKLSYLLFAEKFQDRFITLISLLFYSTAILIPLRLAFLAYNVGQKTFFGDVLLAAYSLFVLLIILFFFNKEDVLKVIPTHTAFFIWLKRKIEKYYYPVFCFIMGLLILSNHSIGYFNLAWYLAFTIPSTIALFYALFFVHNYIRKYSIFIFMQEDEDEIRDKFEHAKTYYGFFVIASFLFLIFGAVVILARIWGFDFMPADLWQLLSERWVVSIGGDNKLGFVQFMMLITFIVGGFLTSSLVHKFMFSKLFDILRTEPGLQNTISRITHYMLIALAFLFGLITIHIDSSYILTVGGLLMVGLGLALKDVLIDFIGGFLMLLERPIEIGNYIELDQFRGTVHKIAARTTTLVTSLNHSIVIPNREFLAKSLTNWGHGRFAVGFEVNVRVRHDSDPELVRRILLSIIQSNQIVLRVPAALVRLEEFEENALYFLARAFISSRRVKDQWEIAAQMRLEILKAFKENHIKLAIPQSLISSEEQGVITDDSLTVKFKQDEK